MKRFARTLTLVSCFALSSCGLNFSQNSSSEDETELLAPAGFSEGLNSLNQKLSVNLSQESGNFAFSTLNIAVLMGMVQQGAAGKTADEIKSLLQIDSIEDFQWIQTQLRTSKEESGYSLNVLNHLWPNIGTELKSTYLKGSKQYFAAQSTTLNMTQEPEASAEAINQWASEQTEKSVQKIVDASSLGGNTSVVLTSAMLLKAQWNAVFDADKSSEFTFYSSPENTMRPVGMRTDLIANIANEDDWTFIEVPFAGHGSERLTMSFLFNNGFAKFDAAVQERLQKSLKPRPIKLTMPRFKIKGEVDLVETLRKLGINAAFDPTLADLSNMIEHADENDVSVSDMIAGTSVDVTETGVFAGSGSSAVINYRGSIEPEESVAIDHPFFFTIRAMETNIPVVSGFVSAPDHPDCDGGC